MRQVIAALLCGFSLCSTAGAVTLTTLASFDGANGWQPFSGLVADANRNLYGTTRIGGANNAGTIFRLSPTGSLTTLFSFNEANGSQPYGGLIVDKSGNLFGTTLLGGSSNLGTVFKLSPSGLLTTLVNFDGPNGERPRSELLADAEGNLFGTTLQGGRRGFGTVFKISSSGTLRSVVSFDRLNGSSPIGGLTADASGNIYGTTALGGAQNLGTVFRLSPSGSLTTLVSFTGSANFTGFFRRDGASPYGGLIADSDGNLFGTTLQGGFSGGGSVFKLSPSGEFSNLGSFGVGFGFGFGTSPYAGLIADADGNLYGTAFNGGPSNRGTVFKLSVSGVFSILASFEGLNGGNPYGGLIADSEGNLYGTAHLGGEFNRGTIFRISGAGFVVPEPNAFALFAIGGAALGRRRRSSASPRLGAR